MFASPHSPSRLRGAPKGAAVKKVGLSPKGRVTFSGPAGNVWSRVLNTMEPIHRPLRRFALGHRLVIKAVGLVFDRCLDD